MEGNGGNVLAYQSNTRYAKANEHASNVVQERATAIRVKNSEMEDSGEAKAEPAATIGAGNVVLGMGIDSLYLTCYVTAWNPEAMDVLKGAKGQAFKSIWPGKSKGSIVAGRQVNLLTDEGLMTFDVEPRGKISNTEGPFGNFNYHIKNRHMDVFISLLAKDANGETEVDEDEPTIPNAKVEIRSETLWLYGVERSWAMVEQVLDVLSLGKYRLECQRVDLCCDTTHVFKPGQRRMIVSLAGKNQRDIYSEIALDDPAFQEFEQRNVFTGWRYTSKAITCRVYRKDVEITSQSRKTWQYDVHGIEQGTEFWRVEFTLRSSVLREFGISDLQSLLDKRGDVWTYLTQRWFSIRQFNNERTSRRTATRMWRDIQEAPITVGWCKEVEPAIRQKAQKNDVTALKQQAMGQLTSMAALNGTNVKDELKALLSLLDDEAMTEKLEQDTSRKRARLRPMG